MCGSKGCQMAMATSPLRSRKPSSSSAWGRPSEIVSHPLPTPNRSHSFARRLRALRRGEEGGGGDGGAVRDVVAASNARSLCG